MTQVAALNQSSGMTTKKPRIGSPLENPDASGGGGIHPLAALFLACSIGAAAAYLYDWTVGLSVFASILDALTRYRPPRED